MPVESCIPVIPSADLEKSLRLWVDGLGFSMSSEMRKDDKLIFCMLRKDGLCFMLNQRAGTPVKPKDYTVDWSPSSTPRASRVRDGSTRRFRYRLTEYLVNAPPACVIEFGPSAA